MRMNTDLEKNNPNSEKCCSDYRKDAISDLYHEAMASVSGTS